MKLTEYMKHTKKKGFVWRGKAKDLKKLLALQKKALKCNK